MLLHLGGNRLQTICRDVLLEINLADSSPTLRDNLEIFEEKSLESCSSLLRVFREENIPGIVECWKRR